MKKMVAVCAIACFAFAGFASHAKYTLDGVVVGSNATTVTVEDSRGHVWEYDWDFRVKSGSLGVGDDVSVKFADNGTDAIEDDIVLDICAK